jgi:hypothetical protein
MSGSAQPAGPNGSAAFDDYEAEVLANEHLPIERRYIPRGMDSDGHASQAATASLAGPSKEGGSGPTPAAGRLGRRPRGGSRIKKPSRRRVARD